MSIWKELYEMAKAEYHPEEVSPFITAHHVVCAVEAENGQIFTGFCIEGCSGVMNLCAERVAALNMYVNSGQTVVKRLIAFRDEPPHGSISPKEGCDQGKIMTRAKSESIILSECSYLSAPAWAPCGACREFFMQLDERNENMEILVDLDTEETVTLGELLPYWWGRERYEQKRREEQRA